MSNTTRIIVIWGAAILLYVAVTKSSGTKTVLGGLTNLVTGTTKTLQGRS